MGAPIYDASLLPGKLLLLAILVSSKAYGVMRASFRLLESLGLMLAVTLQKYLKIALSCQPRIPPVTPGFEIRR